MISDILNSTEKQYSFRSQIVSSIDNEKSRTDIEWVTNGKAEMKFGMEEGLAQIGVETQSGEVTISFDNTDEMREFADWMKRQADAADEYNSKIQHLAQEYELDNMTHEEIDENMPDKDDYFGEQE